MKKKSYLTKISYKKKLFSKNIKRRRFFNPKLKKIKNTHFKQKFKKLKKKWRFWRGFKQFFINKKKITFFKKLQWNYNEKRLIWHQLSKTYLPKIKKIISKKINIKFFFLLNFFELKLPVILLRSRFYTKLTNCYDGIKKNLICVNGNIVNKKTYQLQSLDLYQKRRHVHVYLKKIYKKKHVKRLKRLKWRKFRWKKARFIFWKIRRKSHFNLYFNKKVNSNLNYLEINYKIPAGIIVKKPFTNEFMINKQKNILNNKILKKIFFLY